jgi:hypothetical protein
MSKLGIGRSAVLFLVGSCAVHAILVACSSGGVPMGGRDAGPDALARAEPTATACKRWAVSALVKQDASLNKVFSSATEGQANTLELPDGWEPMTVIPLWCNQDGKTPCVSVTMRRCVQP